MSREHVAWLGSPLGSFRHHLLSGLCGLNLFCGYHEMLHNTVQNGEKPIAFGPPHRACSHLYTIPATRSEARRECCHNAAPNPHGPVAAPAPRFLRRSARISGCSLPASPCNQCEARCTTYCDNRILAATHGSRLSGGRKRVYAVSSAATWSALLCDDLRHFVFLRTQS